jgi:predicted glycosyltransferase involved in capsule biosynthesis
MMAIVVPYRDRKEHLAEFLPHMEKYLHEVPHQIYIVEQDPEKPFNRGKLLNIGYALAKQKAAYVCFHDVDMLPLRADYSYPETPTHLAEAAEQFNFEMPYPTYFGGVTLFNINDFTLANGYSNEYWGWGAEDDDLHHRCLHAGLAIQHRKGVFKSLDHRRPIDNDPFVLANLDRLEEYLYGPDEVPEEGLKTLGYTLLEERTEGNVVFSLVKI